MNPSTQQQADWLVNTVGVRACDDRRVIDVQGEDQRTWLNGQVTQDVRPLAQGGAVYALVLNVRGKILADVWVVERASGLSLIVPTDKAHELQQHLEQYIIMEDVVLSPRDDLRVLSVQGPSSSEVASASEGEFFGCDELGTGGVFVIVDATAAEASLHQLQGRAVAVGGGAIDEAAFDLARVRRGVPRFGQDFDDTCYPQEAGLKARAVSFQKGCYLGQEVVCTLESRGKLSRRLVQLCAGNDPGLQVGPNATAALSAGQAIVTADGQEPSGKLTSVVHDDAGTHALGYVRRLHLDAGKPLQAESGSALRVVGTVGEATSA